MQIKKDKLEAWLHHIETDAIDYLIAPSEESRENLRFLLIGELSAGYTLGFFYDQVVVPNIFHLLKNGYIKGDYESKKEAYDAFTKRIQSLLTPGIKKLLAIREDNDATD